MYYAWDEIEVRTGMAQAFVEFMGVGDVCPAEARGLKLEGVWITPPVEPAGEASRVLVLWSFADAAAFWRQRHGARDDATVGEWWKEAERFVLKRERSYLTPASISPLQ